MSDSTIDVAVNDSANDMTPENQVPDVCCASCGAIRPDSFGELLSEFREIRHLLTEGNGPLLNGKAAARFLSVSVSTLGRLASADEMLRPVKVSAGCTRWKRTALQAYVDRLEA